MSSRKSIPDRQKCLLRAGGSESVEDLLGKEAYSIEVEQQWSCDRLWVDEGETPSVVRTIHDTFTVVMTLAKEVRWDTAETMAS